MSTKAINYEIYTCNPLTGENGWDIKFITVFAEDTKQARVLLKSFPHFDCVILHNYTIDIKDGSVEAKNYATGVNFFEPTMQELYNH